MQRLEKLRVEKQFTWAEMGSLLELSDSMLYQVRSGKKQMSDKAIHRLEMAERELLPTAQLDTDPHPTALREDNVHCGSPAEPTLKDALRALGSALDVLKLLIEKEAKK